MRISETGIDLDGIGELDGRLTVLMIVEVALSTMKVILLTDIRIE
jgi:hypothetical protein